MLYLPGTASMICTIQGIRGLARTAFSLAIFLLASQIAVARCVDFDDTPTTLNALTLEVPELMPGLSAASGTPDDDRAFLDAFYQLFSGSIQNIGDPELTAKMQVYWKEIYTREARKTGTMAN